MVRQLTSRQLLHIEFQYIVCDICGLRYSSFDSSSGLYITPNYSASLHELMLTGIQQKLQKSYFRCTKNTCHVESKHMLQHSMYLIVNPFSYDNNNVTKIDAPYILFSLLILLLVSYSVMIITIIVGMFMSMAIPFEPLISETRYIWFCICSSPGMFCPWIFH